ncbi:MAG TPA: response regulator [Candidatus Limnocylindria bacterium]|nr:response regulator [Candidatus Limnocylindria bacterium]
MLLKLTGNETHIAYDGLEAVEAAATFLPDVVLLDIGLQKLNGYEAARQIRAQPWGRKMVLVALTGWGQDENRHKSWRGRVRRPHRQAGGPRRRHEAAGKDVAERVLSKGLPLRTAHGEPRRRSPL